MVESVAKQVKSDQAPDGTPDGNPEGTPNGVPNAAPDAPTPEKRAGLMAAIRTAMRDIGEDVAGVPPASAPDPGLVEIHPDLPRVNPSLVFGATMALWHPPRFTARELLDTVNEVLEGTGAVAGFDPGMKQADTQPRFSLLKRRLAAPPSAILRVNGLRTLVGGGDKPAFAGKALEERVNPALWAEGVARLSQSRGHVMIADAHPPDPSDPDLNYDRAVAVTVTAAAVSLLTDPSGIIWHPAGNATPPDVIPDFVQSLAEGIAPLPLWLRWLMLPADPGRNPGAATRGLEALLGRELEIVPNDFALEKTVGDLFEIAHARVRLGRAPGDGTQVGTRARTWYHVVHAPRGTASEAPVFRLTPISEYTGERPV
ncbi:MAG TPA: hypothetical protein VMM59_00170 [Thermohalobaculum sp.]|nr:hypothetical protein [Thermohalobaculum sp.]